MNLIERLTMAGIACTLFLQVCASIWWAGNMNSQVGQHTHWITEHSKQQVEYPALVQRVENLEQSMDRLVIKLEDLIDLMYERYSDSHE